MTATEDITALAELMRESRRMVIFTGAGISTESGIPDFRGPQGLWTRGGRPIDFSEFISSEDVRRESWRRRFAGGGGWGGAEPNEGHVAIARLVRSGKAICVITQNVDGLHQKSGVPDSQVVELHGNSTYAVCLSCLKRYEMSEVRAMFEPEEKPPVCTECGGIIKTATISFGQSMPLDAMQRAEAATLRCDFFLVLGSSLVVYPAAAFPMVAKRRGARLAIVNQQETETDPYCDLVIHRQLGPTLTAAVRHLGLNE